MPEPCILRNFVDFEGQNMYFRVFFLLPLCSVTSKTMYFYKVLWPFESENHVFSNVFFGFDNAKTMNFLGFCGFVKAKTI